MAASWGRCIRSSSMGICGPAMSTRAAASALFEGCLGCMVYCHKEATSHKAEGYCNFVPLCVDRDGFWDGIFWAASMELLVDRGQSVTPPRKTDQWIQRAAGVKIVAVWLCGRNSSQMHRQSFITRRWDSKLEANPWRDAGLRVPAEL